MPTSNKDPKTIDTGGGAYFGGSVTAGGDVVGRDQTKTVYHQEGASIEDLRKLLGELRALLPHAALEPDIAEVIEGDFKVVEAQTAKEQPMGALIKSKLKGISDLIQETGKTSDAVEKILKLLGKGLALAGTLF